MNFTMFYIAKRMRSSNFPMMILFTDIWKAGEVCRYVQVRLSRAIQGLGLTETENISKISAYQAEILDW